jgi:hypothetical protein
MQWHYHLGIEQLFFTDCDIRKGELAVGHCQSRKLSVTHLHSRYLLRDTAFSFTLASGHRRPVPPSTGERNFVK